LIRWGKELDYTYEHERDANVRERMLLLRRAGIMEVEEKLPRPEMSSTEMSERALYMETSIHMMEVTFQNLILDYA
jgi:hypothetical protein